MTPNGKGCEWPKCKVPVSPFAETIKVLSAKDDIIQIKFGPAGGGSKQALYYVSRDGDFRGVHKIEYTGTANRGPRAEIFADATYGFKPLRVNFDGTGSIDPDGDELTYQWDFDGDGGVDSTSSKTSFEYNEAGTHYATLTVKDGKGGKSQTEIRIEVENTPPTPVILTPAEGTTFYVGQKFELIGTATDSEEGELDDTHLTWEVRQHHNTHYHPWIDPETPGNNLVIKAPEPEDFDASLTSYLEILLTATDSKGLSATVSRKIYPRKVEVLIDSVPSGLEVVAYGDVHVTPKKVITWDNHIFEVEAYDQTMAGSTYTFDSWNDGGEQTHDFEALPGVTSDEAREGGVHSKNMIIARFSKDGILVQDDSAVVERPADEIGDAEEGSAEANQDEGELAALDKDEGIADLSDFLITIQLNNNDSTVRGRKLSEADLISYLDENLKKITAQTLREEIKAIVKSSEDISYVRPNTVRLALKGRTVRAGKVYKAVFGGIVAFKEKKKGQQLPTEALVQSMQLQAMDELSHDLFYKIKSNLPEARVATVFASTDVPSKLYNVASPTEPGSSGISSSSSDDSVGSSSGSMDSNTVIIVACSIVAGLALIAVTAFFIVRGRRGLRQSDKAGAMVASADEEAPGFPEKKGEAKSLVAQKDEESANDEGAQDLVNNTMSTDVPEATSDDEASTTSKSVAASSLHVGEMEVAAPEGPTAASDDEASTSSTRFGAVE